MSAFWVQIAAVLLAAWAFLGLLAGERARRVKQSEAAARRQPKPASEPADLPGTVSPRPPAAPQKR